MTSTRELKKLKAAFPHAKLATDEEILAFGTKFVRDYRVRMQGELEQFKTMVDLVANRDGEAIPPKQLKLAVELRQGLIDTLERLANVMEGEKNGADNPPGNSGQTQN